MERCLQKFIDENFPRIFNCAVSMKHHIYILPNQFYLSVLEYWKVNITYLMRHLNWKSGV